MKTCPTCHRNYENEMKFCLEDGSTLVAETASGIGSVGGADATLHLPGHSTEQPPTIASQRQTSPQQSTVTSAGVIPPSSGAAVGSSVASAGTARGSNALLWVGTALIIGIAAIAVAVALILIRSRRPAFDSTVETANPSVSPSDTTTGNELSASDSSTKPESVAVEKMQPVPKPKEVVPTVKSVPGGIDTSAPPPPPVEKAKPPAIISGGVLNAKAINLVKPSYPPIAKSAHVSGAVTVQVLIDENGNVISASAVSGHPLLRSSAVNAARSSKFTPTKLSGQPVKVSGVIVYNFVEQ